MVTLITMSLLERALHVVEDSVAIEPDTLEVTALIVGDRHDLLVRSQLSNDFVICPLKDLNVTFVKRHHDKSIIAERIKRLELSSLLRA